MLENYSNEYERKKAIIALLIQMSRSDQQEENIERLMIGSIANKIGLDSETIVEVAKHPERYRLQPPPAEQDRMTILYYLLFLMRSDGDIREEEEKLCYRAGLRLGFNEQLTGDMIRVIKAHPSGPIPPEAMLEVIRKYLN